MYPSLFYIRPGGKTCPHTIFYIPSPAPSGRVEHTQTETQAHVLSVLYIRLSIWFVNICIHLIASMKIC